MKRDKTFLALGLALGASVVIHAGAIGLLDPFVSGTRQALSVPDEPPPMLSIILVGATPQLPQPGASEVAEIPPPREARRRQSVVRRLAGGMSVILPSASDVVIASREPWSPQAPISASGPPVSTPDPPGRDILAAPEMGSTGANADATGTPRGPASAPVTYLGNPSPSYPESARRDGQEGLTVVEVLVSKSGLPVDVRIITTSGFAALDGAAVAGVKRWLFTPAIRDHEATDARILIPIRFRLSEEGN